MKGQKVRKGGLKMSVNSVTLMGRLTKTPELQHVGQSGISKVEFSIALERPKKEGQEKAECDFPRIIAWGKTAENLAKYTDKGLRVYVEGHIQTGNYKNQAGNVIYTTDVVADKVEFIDWKDSKGAANEVRSAVQGPQASVPADAFDMWETL